MNLNLIFIVVAVVVLLVVGAILLNFFSLWFQALMSKAEELFLTGKAPYPIERTLMTTGLVAAGMQSLASGQKRIETPHLAIQYQAPRESLFLKS